MARCLFDGQIPEDTLDEVRKLIDCHCGEQVYIFGCRTMDVFSFSFEDCFEKIHFYPSLLEISNGKATVFHFDGGSDLITFARTCYYIGKDLFVTFSIQQVTVHSRPQYRGDEIYQYIWRLNRKTKRIEKIFYRTISFPGIENFGVSTSRLLSGYVLIFRQKHNYNNFDVPWSLRLVAANPLQCQEFPDIFLDKEIAQFEKECCRRNVAISSQPFISADSIYFVVVSLDESRSSRIGSISKEKGKTKVEFFDIARNEEFWSHILSGYFKGQLIPSDNNGIRWVPYILQKRSAWKEILQESLYMMLQIPLWCMIIPLCLYSEYDNGNLIWRVSRFLEYIFESSILDLDSSLVFMVFNLKNKRSHRFRVNGQEKFPLFTTNVHTTTSPNGDLLVSETSRRGRLRITRFKNPFRVPKLLEIAYEMCKEMYPSTTDKLQNISSVYDCKASM